MEAKHQNILETNRQLHYSGNRGSLAREDRPASKQSDASRKLGRGWNCRQRGQIEIPRRGIFGRVGGRSGRWIAPFEFSRIFAIWPFLRWLFRLVLVARLLSVREASCARLSWMMPAFTRPPPRDYCAQVGAARTSVASYGGRWLMAGIIQLSRAQLASLTLNNLATSTSSKKPTKEWPDGKNTAEIQTEQSIDRIAHQLDKNAATWISI